MQSIEKEYPITQCYSAEMHYRIAICSESNGRLLAALFAYERATNMEHPHAKARMEALQAYLDMADYQLNYGLL